MFEMQTRNGIVKVYAETIEQDAISQIYDMANSSIGESAHIRIMPDAHAGAGCTIGTTMIVKDKVCPNITGVDISCGVNLVRVNEKLNDRLNELDMVVRTYIPFGKNVHNRQVQDSSFFKRMYCWDKLKKEAREKALCSLGTLGGGNHFIECYDDGYISVHSGSRNIGLNVAKFYQEMAQDDYKRSKKERFEKLISEIEPKHREEFIKKSRKENPVIPYSLCYLTGEHMEMYLHDLYIMTEFAEHNRERMLNVICEKMGLKILESIVSTHNYIEKGTRILRKGAISAKEGEKLVIPLNMRDGILVCTGKGNEDWNFSAPHGAGRLYSRSEAKRIFSVEEYIDSMDGIFTTCVNSGTLDEAPFVYKDYQEIMEAIKDTVEINKRLKPIYNFKASE